MNIYDNDYTSAPRKVSPYADSPYACVCEPTAQPREAPQAIAEPKPKKRRWKGFVVFILLVCACGVTAMLVWGLCQARYEKMELAMQERFDALEQLYSENRNQNSQSQIPQQGPLTPSQVYDKNVQAVVAVKAAYEKSGNYGESAGSGFVISADGYVATNYHVIEGAAQVTVITPKGDSLKAEIIGKDAANDVALLKVEAENLPFVTLGSSDALVVGDMVMAIGNPLGDLTSTLTVGYVSAKDRIVNTDGTVINMLQTDAAINSGNSGGPLFNTKGEVIGIITAKYSGDSGSGATIEGLGFAIPMDDVAGILSDLKEFGYVTGAYLGVQVRDVDAAGQSYGLPAGAYVVEVVKGNAAHAAGIRAGDIIINLGGYEVDSLTTLTRVLRRFEAGQTISVTVYRSGRQEILSVTLDEKPVQTEEPSAPNGNQIPNNFGDWFGGLFP